MIRPVYPMLLSGNPIKCHEEFFFVFAAYMIPPNLNLLTFSPTDWGMLRIKVWMR